MHTNLIPLLNAAPSFVCVVLISLLLVPSMCIIQIIHDTIDVFLYVLYDGGSNWIFWCEVTVHIRFHQLYLHENTNVKQVEQQGDLI